MCWSHATPTICPCIVSRRCWDGNPSVASGCRGDPARQRGRSFFARDPVPLEEAPQRAVAEPVPVRAERAAQLHNGGIPHLVEQPQDQCCLRLNQTRASIATNRAWPDIALLALQCQPPTHAGGADTEPCGCLAMRRTFRHCRQNPPAKINR
jgi:hypothetical protein